MLYDVSSSYYEGHTCPLARLGHNRDGKKGLPIIVYGLLTDSEGRPVAVDVYPGNTGDPTTVPDQVEKLRQRFGLSRVVLVGDRGMLTEAQIGKLKQHPGLGWISALRGPAIRELVESGSLQLSLFDEMNLAEIQFARLSRRAPGSLLQPPAGRRAPAQARRVDRGDREGLGQDRRPGQAPHAHPARRGRDRAEGGQGLEPLQGRQALLAHHRRRRLRLDSARRIHPARKPNWTASTWCAPVSPSAAARPKTRCAATRAWRRWNAPSAA